MVLATASRPTIARMSSGLCMTTSSASRAANCAAVACPNFAKFADWVHEGSFVSRRQGLLAGAGGIGSATSVAIFQPSGVLTHVTIIRNGLGVAVWPA